ncbi:MAG: YihY/virulence factor BrkB family protein [Crocinitomicaceae bacterium]
MPIKDKINRLIRIVRAIYIRKFIHITRLIKLPGFQGVSLWEIIFFFLYSIRKGLIGMRAASVAFHFFLAMIPFGLVLVVLTSYTPGLNLEADIAPVISALIPDQLFNKFISGVHEYEHSSVSSWLSVGFVLALYFTSNGFNVLIRAFNSSKMKFEKRKWWSIRLVSLGFVFIFILGIIFTFYFIILVRMGLIKLSNTSDFVTNYFDTIYVGIDIIALGAMLYFGIALLYYMGPRRRSQFKFFSPGATLATLLILIISVFYELYIAYYASYNDLYGSLGTIMILLFWIYLISYALLIGFELNASIHGAMHQKSLSRLQDLETRYDKAT